MSCPHLQALHPGLGRVKAIIFAGPTDTPAQEAWMCVYDDNKTDNASGFTKNRVNSTTMLNYGLKKNSSCEFSGSNVPYQMQFCRLGPVVVLLCFSNKQAPTRPTPQTMPRESPIISQTVTSLTQTLHTEGNVLVTSLPWTSSPLEGNESIKAISHPCLQHVAKRTRFFSPSSKAWPRFMRTNDEGESHVIICSACLVKCFLLLLRLRLPSVPQCPAVTQRVLPAKAPSFQCKCCF